MPRWIGAIKSIEYPRQVFLRYRVTRILDGKRRTAAASLDANANAASGRSMANSI